MNFGGWGKRVKQRMTWGKRGMRTKEVNKSNKGSPSRQRYLLYTFWQGGAIVGNAGRAKRGEGLASEQERSLWGCVKITRYTN